MAKFFVGKFDYKLILAIFIVLLSITSQLNAQEETEIYRWVDENGNVHYSDLPQNDQAELITVKKGSSASAVKSDVVLPEIPEKPSMSKASENKSKALPVREEFYQADASSCEYLKDEIKKSQKVMRSKNESKAKHAANHVDTLKIMLAQGQCN